MSKQYFGGDMQRINVTKTFLPPVEEYEKYLQQIWQSNQLTNQGPLLIEFQTKVKEYLGISDFHFVTNGTIALQLALRALDITDGEVITTPFSYVASTSAILWERCTPVFVDIEPDTFCLDPKKIEAAITEKTKAILAVHVFGNPCDVETISAIAEKHNLKVIYDAAHAFGVKYKETSLLNYGDISTCSFHSTKLFHTIEGGGIVAHSAKVSSQIELMKRFGHNGDDHFTLGINAKSTEFNAAMGLCNLGYVDDIIEQRKKIWMRYTKQLKDFRTPKIQKNTIYNYAYYPLVCESETELLAIIKHLNERNVFPRRYFYPSLNKLPYHINEHSCPVSEDIASRIMCLPLYHGLSLEEVDNICETIKR